MTRIATRLAIGCLGLLFAASTQLQPARIFGTEAESLWRKAMKCAGLLLFFFFPLTTPLLAQLNPANFAPVVTYGPGGYGTSSVVVGDVNGDGKPDLVVANYCAGSSNCNNGTVGVLLGNGDGTFQTAATYNSGYTSLSVAVADVNGDGKPDLVVANLCVSSNNCNSGSVSVLLGNGDGTFQAAVSYSSGGTGTRFITIGDVNGDGKPDVVVANYDQNAVGVLLGNGDGTFQAAVSYSSGGIGPLSVTIGDVNGDGKLDLLVPNVCAISNGLCYYGVVGVLLGNGDGTFAVPGAIRKCCWSPKPTK